MSLCGAADEEARFEFNSCYMFTASLFLLALVVLMTVVDILRRFFCHTCDGFGYKPHVLLVSSHIFHLYIIMKKSRPWLLDCRISSFHLLMDIFFVERKWQRIKLFERHGSSYQCRYQQPININLTSSTVPSSLWHRCYHAVDVYLSHCNITAFTYAQIWSNNLGYFPGISHARCRRWFTHLRWILSNHRSSVRRLIESIYLHVYAIQCLYEPLHCVHEFCINVYCQ